MFKGIFYSVLLLGSLVPTFVDAQELAIPRFVSFRHAITNMRRGPGDKYPILYVYHVPNYPVEVIDEHEMWRRVREVDGTIGWVNRRLLSGHRYIILTKEAPLYKKPNSESTKIAHIQKGSIAKLKECPAQSVYCKVLLTFEDKKYEGWLNKNTFYGVYPHEVIN